MKQTTKWVLLVALVFTFYLACEFVGDRYDDLYLVSLLGYPIFFLGFYYSFYKYFVSKRKKTVDDEMTQYVRSWASEKSLFILFPLIWIGWGLYTAKDRIGLWAETAGWSITITVVIVITTYIVLALYKQRSLRK